jgi:serine/threonine-protein kinase RsbW
MRLQMRMTLPREAVSVSLARGLLGATLKRAGVVQGALHDIEVALTEACTNAYQHVEAGDTYEVVIDLDDELLAMQVIDHGPGFSARPTEEQDFGADASTEDGRGVELIRALTDTAAFGVVAEDDGGSVRMWKKVAWGDEAPWLRATRIGEDGLPASRDARGYAGDGDG